MKNVLDKVAAIVPEEIGTSTPEVLVMNYDMIRQVQGLLEVMKKEIGSELLNRFEGNGTVIANFAVTRTRRASYAKVELEVARTFGAVTEAIDTKVLAKLTAKGQEIPGITYSEFPTVKSLTVSENEEEVA
jgi:hypothetical protein